MGPSNSNTDLLPPALRALALGLLVETVVPVRNKSRAEGPVSPGRGERGPGGNAELCHALRCKCGELSALVLRADDPGEAAAYVLGYLPKHFEYMLDLLYCQKARRASGGPRVVGPVAPRDEGHGADPA